MSPAGGATCRVRAWRVRSPDWRRRTATVPTPVPPAVERLRRANLRTLRGPDPLPTAYRGGFDHATAPAGRAIVAGWAPHPDTARGCRRPTRWWSTGWPWLRADPAERIA